MKNLTSSKTIQTKGTVSGKQYSYGEIIEFLDGHWDDSLRDRSLTTIKKLDKAFGNLSQKTNTIIIAGTNGKSLTAHFATRLLKQEGLAVGCCGANSGIQDPAIVGDFGILHQVDKDLAELARRGTVGYRQQRRQTHLRIRVGEQSALDDCRNRVRFGG